MRIAQLSTFYPFRGGIAQFNAALYRSFEQNNHQVKAFTFTTQYPNILFPGSSQYTTKDDIVDKIDAGRVLNTVNPITYFTAANAIKKHRPDLLLMKFWLPFFAPSLGVVANRLKRNTKIITILDNVIPHEKRPGDMALTKFFLKQNHGFVVMSDAVKNDLLKLHPSAKYIYHEHPLYDHFGAKLKTDDARKKLNIDPSKKIILFFGFIRDYKGLDLLIKAMENTPDDFYLIIAGETYGDFSPYEKLIHDLGLNSKIETHVRYIADHEVPLFFSAADVCVLPYKSATQSGVTSISYHFDLPIIATNVGGLQETVHHQKTGLIVSSPSEKLIHESLLEYFTKNLKNTFQENIPQLKQQYSWEHLGNSIIEFQKEL